MVKFCNALNATLEQYGITNTWLAEKSGVTGQTISNYRLGKSRLRDDSLEKIINALPNDAQDFYFNQLRPIRKDLRSLILKSSKQEKAEVLDLIAKYLVSDITEEGKLPIAV